MFSYMYAFWYTLSIILFTKENRDFKENIFLEIFSYLYYNTDSNLVEACLPPFILRGVYEGRNNQANWQSTRRLSCVY